MVIECLWEHNGEDTLLHAVHLPGCAVRGKSLREAEEKMPREAAAFSHWCGIAMEELPSVQVVCEKVSDLNIADADSDVLYDSEREPLSREEYERLKALALKSARDFHALYASVPDKTESVLQQRNTFYGPLPRTAEEMYRHTKGVNAYYFAEIGIDADNEGSIYDCRVRGFETLEQTEAFLDNRVFDGSYGELWSLRKLLRRFLWHDRIHARAMFRMAEKTFGAGSTADPFFFRDA